MELFICRTLTRTAKHGRHRFKRIHRTGLEQSSTLSRLGASHWPVGIDADVAVGRRRQVQFMSHKNEQTQILCLILATLCCVAINYRAEKRGRD